MWKLEHAEGQREINELHVPVGRDVKLIMTSQDVIHSFFVPAFRMKQDVLARPLHGRMVPRHQSRHLSSVLRRILRHPALRHDRLHRRHGARAVRSLDGRRLHRSALRYGRKDFRRTRLRHLPSHRLAGSWPESYREFSASRCQLEDGRTVTADENYLRESHSRSRRESGERLQARHADLPGIGDRRASECAGRLREIDGEARRERSRDELARLLRKATPRPQEVRCNRYGDSNSNRFNPSSGRIT